MSLNDTSSLMYFVELRLHLEKCSVRCKKISWLHFEDMCHVYVYQKMHLHIHVYGINICMLPGKGIMYGGVNASKKDSNGLKVFQPVVKNV